MKACQFNIDPQITDQTTPGAQQEVWLQDWLALKPSGWPAALQLTSVLHAAVGAHLAQ